MKLYRYEPFSRSIQETDLASIVHALSDLLGPAFRSLAPLAHANHLAASEGNRCRLGTTRDGRVFSGEKWWMIAGTC